MIHHLMPELSAGSFYFRLFYLLAFLVAYLVIIYEGYKRKFPLLTWILIIACVRLFVVSGTKLFAYSREEWQFIFDNHALIVGAKKTLFGGMALGFVGYLIGRVWFRFRQNALDTVAVALPLGISIQKIGCFFAGCCFGNPTDLPWAIKYPVMTLPHYHHYQQGLITINDLYSLPVHPAQLYYALGGLLVVIMVIKTRKYWKASGSSFLSALIFYAAVRFFLEFLRDPLANKNGGEQFWMLKVIQWQLMLFALLMTAILVYRERRGKTSPIVVSDAPPELNSSFLFVFLLVTIFFLLRKWFTTTEIIAMNIAILPAVALVGIKIFRAFAVTRYKWVYAGMLILPVLLMSQTLSRTAKDSNTAKQYNTYHTVSSGLAKGDFINSHTIGQGEGCDRVENTEYFNQRYKQAGAGYSYTMERTDRNEIIEFGMRAYFGNHSQTRMSDNAVDKSLIIGINPYVCYDIKWIGIGAGLHFGNLRYARENHNVEGSEIPLSGIQVTPVYPMFYFRAGVKKYFFGEFHLADQFPSSLPGMRYQVAIGSGFGLKNGFMLRFGTTNLRISDDYGNNPFKLLQSEFISVTIPIKDMVVIEPLYLWGQQDYYYTGQYPSSPQYQFSLGLHYRFGHQEKTKSKQPVK